MLKAQKSKKYLSICLLVVHPNHTNEVVEFIATKMYV